MNLKKLLLEASASIHDQQRIITFTFPASGDFSTFDMRTPEIFADVILVRAETIKSFAIYFTVCWIIFISNNRGAPLLGLAKSIYYCRTKMSRNTCIHI